jgi:hypothetical protein
MKAKSEQEREWEAHRGGVKSSAPQLLQNEQKRQSGKHEGGITGTENAYLH